MEVFVRNVPMELNREAFQREFDPIMERLQLVDYMCDKSRSKRFGFITFLRQDDGYRFLAAHGEEEIPGSLHGVSRFRPRLSFMGVDIFCKLGDRQPNPLVIRTLEHEAEERKRRLGIMPETIISFHMMALSCGRCDFVGEQLVYTPEEAWTMEGIMKFRKRDIVVKTTSHIIRMPLITVVGMICSREGVLTVTLSDVPFFFEVETFNGAGVDFQFIAMNPNYEPPIAARRRSRVCALSDEDRKSVV